MGTIQIDGSTPRLTIGNATAEDATILFDGNAQDFYIALDDSADDLLIGLGSTVGTTPMLSFTEAKAAAFTGAVTMASTLGVTGVVTGAGFTAGSAVLAAAELELLDGLTAGTAIASKVVTTDANIDTTGQRNLTISGELDAATLDISGNADIDGTTNLDAVDIDGAVQLDSTFTVGVDDTGHDVKFFGATASSHMLWDESADDLNLVASGLGVGTVGTKDLGAGIHIKTADSGASVNANGNELVIEGSDDTGISILTGTGATGNIYFADSGDDDIGRIAYEHNGNFMRFDTNAGERMRINSSGDLCLGKTVPVSASQLGGVTLAPLGRCNISYTGTGGHATMSYFNGNGEIGSISCSGSATSFNTSSDYRLKENETSITDGINRIKQLKPYKFNFKTDADKTVDGFFAHEVFSIVPEAITGEKDAMHPEVLYDEEILYTPEDELPEGKEVGDVKHLIGDVKEETKINPQGIDQSKLVPLLVASLQEAITKIETLETKVTALEG